MMRFAKEALLAVIMALGLGLLVPEALADSPPKRGSVAAESPSFLPFDQIGEKGRWTGVWLALYGAEGTADVSGFGPPFGFSSDGQMAIGAVGVSVQTGKLVWGAEVSYGWVFGHLNDIGVDNQLAVTATLGYLVTPDVQLYGHGGWARWNTSFGDVDGWQFGPGVEVRIPNSPISIDFRYAYGTWDVDGLPSSFDVHTHVGMAGLKYRF